MSDYNMFAVQFHYFFPGTFGTRGRVPSNSFAFDSSSPED